MGVADVRARLDERGLKVSTANRLPNDMGDQLRLESGAIVNIFDNGTVQLQGRNQDAVREALGIDGDGSSNGTPAIPVAKTKVFVVYGHDGACRTQLEAMLRRWRLDPLILDQLPTTGQTIIEKLENAMAEADFGIVLATPDDEGHRAGHEDERMFRARQNVVFEMGMLLAKLGRPRVAILLKDQARMERPSDIQGLIYYQFRDDVAEVQVQLAKTMAENGYRINLRDL